MLSDVFTKIKLKLELSKEEVKRLLEINVNSEYFYTLINMANELSRNKFAKGKIFAQIGIDRSPCSKNCNFCFFGKKHNLIENETLLNDIHIINNVKKFIKEDADEFFIMATGDFPKEKFIEISKKIKKIIPPNKKLVANIGDFDKDFVQILENIGFTGVYHICRLREGIDTDIPLKERLNTLNVIKNSNLDLYYCIEPIGTEHTYDEIIEEIFRGKELNAKVMAVMKRVSVKGTFFQNYEEVNDLEIAKICAVTRIVMGDSIRDMGVHEPNQISLISGANQIYAENGNNPRDIAENTNDNRGLSVQQCKTLLKNSNWKI